MLADRAPKGMAAIQSPGVTVRSKFDNRLRDHIKESVSMYQVLELLGMEPPNRQHKIRSVANPGDNTPSLHIYHDHWYDYSTGQGGDQIKFVEMVTGCTFGEALSMLGGKAGISTRSKYGVSRPKLEDLTDRFDDEPVGSKSAKARAAGWVAGKWPFLELDDLTGFGVKVCEHALWIPHRDRQDVVRGIKVRDTYSGVKHAVKGSRFTSFLYRVEPVLQSGVALLVEGESDLWCVQKWINSRGLNSAVRVYALPGGAGTWRPEWMSIFDGHHVTILCLDDDKAGQEATQRITEAIGAHRAGSLVPPGGRVAEAIDDADQWLEPVLRWGLSHGDTSIC